MYSDNRRLSVCALIPYPPDRVPSQRFRLEQWLPALQDVGIDIELRPFADERLMEVLHQPGRPIAKAAALAAAFARRIADVIAAPRYDAVVIHRAACLVGPALLERVLKLLSCPVIFDFDDAIFALHTTAANRHFGWLKFPQKTSAICRISSHIVVGNKFLADYARQFNDRVTIIPTSIETDRYRALRKSHNGNGQPVIIGWTGSATSQTHLEMFVPVLSELLKRRAVELRVVSNREPELPGIPYVWRPWEPATEIEEISRFDIGIMPMPDDQWARGKCALKALQCMATRTPVVCSAVGANVEVIRHGENGLLASTPEEWIRNLERLVDDPALRHRLGSAGQQTVEERYSTQRCARMFAAVVRQTLGQYRGESVE